MKGALTYRFKVKRQVNINKKPDYLFLSALKIVWLVYEPPTAVWTMLEPDRARELTQLLPKTLKG